MSVKRTYRCNLCNERIDNDAHPREAPPLGVMPQWRWRELRVQELTEAISRQFQQTKRPNFELVVKWNEEIATHIGWLLSRAESAKTECVLPMVPDESVEGITEEEFRDFNRRYVGSLIELAKKSKPIIY